MAIDNATAVCTAFPTVWQPRSLKRVK